MSRTGKSIKNIVFGLAAQLVTTIITFISKTIMLNALGIEIVSLNGLFHEVISTLSLAELGIGSAIVFNLYKPLAEGNSEKVCQLMTFFKKAYRIIAGAVFIIGSVVCIFIPLIVKDVDFDNTYMRFVFMLFVINIACSYLFSYKISLLNADQNNYVYSIYGSLLSIIGSTITISIMYFTKNFVIYSASGIIVTLASNMAISKIVDKRYAFLHSAELPKADRANIFSNIKNIFIKELSGKITSSTDNILISIIISTLVVGQYSFYSTILAVLKQFTERIEVNIRASMGNLFASESNENCIRVLHRLTVGYGALGTFFAVCFYSSCQSFIALWVGEQYWLTWPVIFVLSMNLYCYIFAKPIYSAMHVSGLFKEGRNISILGSIVNLVTSIILANYIGLAGIFIGTFLTYLIQIILKIYYVYRLRFQCSAKSYIWLVCKFSIIWAGLMFGCNYICRYIDTSHNIVDFILKGIISALITIAVIIVCFFRTEEFKYYKSLAFIALSKIRLKKLEK